MLRNYGLKNLYIVAMTFDRKVMITPLYLENLKLKIFKASVLFTSIRV